MPASFVTGSAAPNVANAPFLPNARVPRITVSLVHAREILAALGLDPVFQPIPLATAKEECATYLRIAVGSPVDDAKPSTRRLAGYITSKIRIISLIVDAGIAAGDTHLLVLPDGR